MVMAMTTTNRQDRGGSVGRRCTGLQPYRVAACRDRRRHGAAQVDSRANELHQHHYCYPHTPSTSRHHTILFVLSQSVYLPHSLALFNSILACLPISLLSRRVMTLLSASISLSYLYLSLSCEASLFWQRESSSSSSYSTHSVTMR